MAISNVQEKARTESPALTPYFDIVARVADKIMYARNIVGVGLGYTLPDGQRTGEPGIELYVRNRRVDSITTEKALQLFPGLRTTVIETGDVLHASNGNSLRSRPLEGGISIGSARRQNAGTLGGWARDLTDDSVVLVTCAHVLLNGAEVTWWPRAIDQLRRIPLARSFAERGVIQPGRLDGGRPNGDHVGFTKRSSQIPLNPFYGRARVARVDAAIAKLYEESNDCLVRNAGRAIVRTKPPQPDMRVQKHGRTTGHTNNGVVSALGQVVNIGYGPAWGRLGVRESVFRVNSTDGRPFALEGDSGALVVEASPGVTGAASSAVVGMVCGVQHFNDQPVGTSVIVLAIDDVLEDLLLGKLQ